LPSRHCAPFGNATPTVENFAFKQVFGSADFIQPDYVVFNIKGNKYRVIARISFHYKRVWIKHVFTHAEYDRWRP
jgi:mRNA interferase HigB